MYVHAKVMHIHAKVMHVHAKIHAHYKYNINYK